MRPSPRRARLAAAAALGLLGAGLATLPAAGQGTSPPPAGTPSVSLTTRASAPVTRRGRISDTAILAGGTRPTGTITFRVYGPSDPTCAAVPATISESTVTGDGTYASAPYVAPTAGVYRFVARYGGDGANPPVATRCGDPGEAVAVTNPPPPVLGRSFQVGPLSGTIYYTLPAGQGRTAATSAAAKGIGFEALAESRTLPVGSVIDATEGVARITTAAGAGRLQQGDFAAGAFTVRQSPTARGLAELDLMVGRAALTSCATTTTTATPAAPAASAASLAPGDPGRARTAARRRLSARVLALLRSTAAGSFRTSGRFSAATVRGTAWDTIDRCDGTLTRVHRGVVVVTDFRRVR
ncbi:MAG TPA: hypothetical protein VFR49_02395, partial [Solirubrobacteraceae bacterium]|nr:hypothetical protein [Solirubrobacteraceae bacterium]